MLYCTRKIIETEILGHLSRKLELYGRKYGFQSGLSPTVTLIDVEAVLRSRKNKIEKLDLAKADDKFNRTYYL